MLPTPHQQSAKYIPTPMELLLGGNAKSSPATAATAATAAMVPLPRLHAAATTAGTTSLASLLNLPPPIPLQSFQTGLLQQPMQPVGPPSILLQMLEKGTPTAGDHSPSPRVAPLSSSGLATPPLLIATSVSSTETVPSDTGSHESTGTLVRCAPCSMQFASQAKLDMHTRIDHILCDLNGCAFTACKRVVIRHRQDCHPPVGKTFVCLDTPEEIEKWRAERRKRYPTNANMEAKAELPPKSKATKRASEKRVSSSAVAAAEEEGNPRKASATRQSNRRRHTCDRKLRRRR
ncbi:hypothetical protein CAOG_00579 [Capsaspora owczarzaki ATCC 30864]|uniref:C2H2-type domain-containing protein n=1 Tax=Capsaspora owczarzaki (strain ATCC 30864) TaxID=595528 RepID=A0A0D2WHD7_CAPO3|nr:hypothetical protein CAOG_00579 [Capsaspora owczarzaki ATCC 30864]KJE89020.1 hypothetical protein CAOG_000579 [Capsaspora owczarzaki ATCC 30864]|eukprot:XP_004365450.2 hypothetical protein CAOG_00579 [Capsaspora owczarzaki ATCC 30864]